MIWAVTFLRSGLGQIAVLVLGVLALWGAFKSHYETRGADKERAAIESANHATINAANTAADKSRNSADGVRDPWAAKTVD